MKNQFYIFALAMQFLTRLPIPSQAIYSAERMTRIAAYFPLVGALIGVVIAAFLALLASIFPWTFSVIGAVAVGLLLTGAFHEDGLADTFDGLGGSHLRDRALEIMRDSRIGTYGTLALLCSLGLKIAALISLAPPSVFAVIICGHCLSRLSSVIVIASSSYVREEGTGKPVAAGISRTDLGIALFSSVAVAAITTALLPVGFGLLPAFLGLLIAHAVLRLWIHYRLGGYSGDTLGAIQQCSELGFYAGALIQV